MPENKIKFSRNDRRNRDKENMMGMQKAVDNYIPDGYKGEASGVVEGLSQLEIDNIESYLNRELNNGKTLEIIVKELQILYNKVKANKSDGISNDLKIASMRFMKGAIGYVKSKGIYNGRLSESSQSNNERFYERGNGNTVQGFSRQGSNGTRLSGNL